MPKIVAQTPSFGAPTFTTPPEVHEQDFDDRKNIPKWLWYAMKFLLIKLFLLWSER